MSDFKAMKRSSGGSKGLEELRKKVEESEKTGFERDKRYYVPKADDEKNGNVTIRFLPAAPGDADHNQTFVEIWKHSFKNEVNGRWYIENSLTTLKNPSGKGNMADPVSDNNSELWKTGIKE